MEDIYTLGRYKVIKELFNSEMQSAYICTPSEAGDLDEEYVINVYKNREVIDIVLQHLFILEDNNFGDYLQHFVYDKYVCAVFKRRQGMLLNQYIKKHSLTVSESLELSKGIIKKTISLKRMPVALLTKLLDYNNILVTDNGIEFVYVLDCRDKTFLIDDIDLVIRIGMVLDFIFSDMQKIPKKIQKIIDKCIRGKYNSLLEICPELEDVIKSSGGTDEKSTDDCQSNEMSLSPDRREQTSLSDTQRTEISELLSKYSDIIGVDNSDKDKEVKEQKDNKSKRNRAKDVILFTKMLLVFFVIIVLLFILYIILFPDSFFLGLKNSFIRDSIVQLFSRT